MEHQSTGTKDLVCWTDIVSQFIFIEILLWECILVLFFRRIGLLRSCRFGQYNPWHGLDVAIKTADHGSHPPIPALFILYRLASSVSMAFFVNFQLHAALSNPFKWSILYDFDLQISRGIEFFDIKSFVMLHISDFIVPNSYLNHCTNALSLEIEEIFSTAIIFQCFSYADDATVHKYLLKDFE